MIAAEQQVPPVASGRIGIPGRLAALWGLAGVVAVLGYAIWRLAGHVATAAAEAGLIEGTLMVANVAFMTWAEGIRGFQQRFAPRVSARALALARDPDWVSAVLAPLFCAGFFRATPRVLRITWLGAGLIALAVLAVQLVPQPWRGILDAGVVAGLGWGIASHVWFGRQALRTGAAEASAELA